jgi:hypothetical protein
MQNRIAALVCIVLLGISLGGCTKCGWIWNDWPKSCHADVPVTR